MGANQSYMAAQPQPVPNGLAAFASPDGSPHTYVAKQPLTLHVKENLMSFTGDSFTVTDARTGSLWFKMRGKKLTLSQRKVMEDVAGAPVFTMKHKKLTMHNTINVFAGTSEGQPAIEARQETQLIQMYKRCTIRATVLDVISRQPVQLTLLGDARGKSGVILLGSESSHHVIAKMYKPTTATSLFMDSQAYNVDIAPGVDTALITAMCVIWDEAVHDQNSGTSVAGAVF